jgi:hypothetical protein
VLEQDFIQRLALGISLEDAKALSVLIDQARWISPNAAFATVWGLLQATAKSPSEASTRLATLTSIESRFHHPLSGAVVGAARKVVCDERLSLADAAAVVQAISAFPGQYFALDIVVHSCNEEARAELKVKRDTIASGWRTISESE